jgi:hypothetical protein
VICVEVSSCCFPSTLEGADPKSCLVSVHSKRAKFSCCTGSKLVACCCVGIICASIAMIVGSTISLALSFLSSVCYVGAAVPKAFDEPMPSGLSFGCHPCFGL